MDKKRRIEMTRENITVVDTHANGGDGRAAAAKTNSELIDEAVRRAINEYGEVLRRLADE